MTLDRHPARAGTASSPSWPAPSVGIAAGSTEPSLSFARHLLAVEHALTVVLSPLDHPRTQAWVDAVAGAFLTLAGADRAEVLLPMDGASAPAGPRTLWARDELGNDESRGEAAAASRDHDSLGIRVRTSSGAAACVVVWSDRWRGEAIPLNLVAAFRAVAPAFRAGVETWARAAVRRRDMARVLDSLSDAALLFGLDGNLMHVNPALDRAADEADVARLRAEAQRVAWALGAIAGRRLTGDAGPLSPTVAASNRGDAAPVLHSVREQRLGSTVYTLRGSVVGEQLAGHRPAVLVMVTAAAPEPLSDAALRARYGLTVREVEVVRLVAEGLSNSEIAERLGVRFFTARNHVERALGKLGLASRHRVGPMLRNESSETEGRASAA